MKIALTGHKTERLRGKEQQVNEWLISILNKLNEGQSEIEYLCGCAKGADEIFGQMAYYFPFVSLTLCMPIKDYRREDLKELRSRANDIVYMFDTWDHKADDIRDKYMVDHCDILLAIWDGNKEGGTWSTIKYAISQNKPIIYFPKKILLNN